MRTRVTSVCSPSIHSQGLQWSGSGFSKVDIFRSQEAVAEGKTHGGKDSVAIWAGIAAGDALAAGVACAAGD